MIKLTIPRIIPSNNKLLRMHWRDQRRLSKLWAEEVMVAKCEQIQNVPRLLKELRKVDIVSYRRQLIKDDDNLYGGCKPVLDALVDNGLIFDDARDFCKLDVYQVKDKENPRTAIVIKRSSKGI